MQYHQITSEERYAIAALWRQGYSSRAIARDLGRAPSTVFREVARNRRADGGYRAFTACKRTSARRTRSRRNERITSETWELVERCLRLDRSPEQVAGFLRAWGILRISHETIYLHVWADKRAGGLWTHVRQAGKKRRKRYGACDSRARLAGKRHISERPPEAEERRELGHWEIDTVMGNEHGPNSVIALVEAATGTLFYFATPHHSWERCANENTNGLVRQYLPKRKSMAHVTQADCDAIAAKLNSRSSHPARTCGTSLRAMSQTMRSSTCR